ncbi:unnamed protein product [Rotaria sordida]|uniref:Uncharacterized protein n=1 Tax=Rotaria sordida TaxID=392033 RepID=A0A813X6L9_9BILA|nr:unnamed protein product [Rotaria sordida]CAF1000401.1 unnamed protein product [Rotaria sordida]
MAINSSYVMPDANTITVTTGLSSCDNTTLDLNKTIYDLRNLYQNNISNLTSNLFFNISISNFNCSRRNGNYFEQIITFTQSISIRIQILFASIYYDYINANNYQFNGFIIDRESYFNFSSITVNNTAKSDACSSAQAAQDPLCLTNLTHPICTLLPNRWNVTCSQNFLTTIISLFGSTTMSNSQLEMPIISSGLNSWQIGLICSLSILFVLILILIIVYFSRRFIHSKSLTISHINLFNDTNLMNKSETPRSQVFQRTATILQSKHDNNTTISRIHNSTTANTDYNGQNCIDIKPAELFHQVRFVDHAKIYDPDFSSNLPLKPMTSANVPTSPSNRTVPKVISTGVTSRPVSRTSMIQLKAITDELQEDKLNESDNISLNQSYSSSPKKPSTPVSRHIGNISIFDESLHDEDAWMSILDVVNAELDALNEQDRANSLT